MILIVSTKINYSDRLIRRHLFSTYCAHCVVGDTKRNNTCSCSVPAHILAGKIDTHKNKPDTKRARAKTIEDQAVFQECPRGRNQF